MLVPCHQRDVQWPSGNYLDCERLLRRHDTYRLLYSKQELKNHSETLGFISSTPAFFKNSIHATRQQATLSQYRRGVSHNGQPSLLVDQS